MPDKHLSTQFDSELNSVSSRVMELGGLVEAADSPGHLRLVAIQHRSCDQVMETEAARQHHGS
jgi:phosphate transport system protein